MNNSHEDFSSVEGNRRGDLLVSFLLCLSPQCRVCLAKLLFHAIILKSSVNCHKTVVFPLPIIIKTVLRIYTPDSMPFLLHIRISVLQPTFTWNANDFPSFSFSLHFKNGSLLELQCSLYFRFLRKLPWTCISR